MFIEALFTIAKMWKQPKCPSTDDWIKKRWYIYTMEYYSAIKTNNITPFAATWMLLKNVILSEVSQKEKEKYHMRSLICLVCRVASESETESSTLCHWWHCVVILCGASLQWPLPCFI
ncbi:LINE-1 retrotransposable element ORF2 protein [Camelus dromedarius]|uniref:LINE-1 retrotransposable element ORF2 protein n=1 Tax=Camelus dromedarius TaxID=9838 RepID=A0A5N4C698_CAMDR|nr:LINE-1 retrotransposable element ORF2 protein [Camelus dromedarius]